MRESIEWFNRALAVAIQLYFRQECEYGRLEEVHPPRNGWMEGVTGCPDIRFGERIVVMLALMPHVCPQVLDIFFVQNKDFDRQYTEFGGWKGLSHGGFLPTGETVSFILAGEDIEKRKEVLRLFGRDHWFYSANVLRLEGAGEGEPFLSGQLRVTEEFLSRVLLDTEYKPDYNIGFPAKRITTELDWEDMILDYQVEAELEEINTWISSGKTIMEDWGLSRFLKAGYRSLFYGPPGTGKTLAATLLGKKNRMDVCRIDLFGKRTSTNTSNDRHANQEVAYLLQRIEDFPGIIILATNLRSNIDEAFSRRFQSVVYFPMPTPELRAELWRKMLPTRWLGGEADEMVALAAETELSGGSITNVVRRCALYMVKSKEKMLNKRILKETLQKEKMKN